MSAPSSPRLNVVMLVGGFPLEINPDRGIFNKRAAENLSVVHKVSVIFPRFWKPGKKLITHTYENGYDLYILYVPFPFPPSIKSLQIRLFAFFISILLKRTLKQADVLHSVGADGMGLITSSLAKKYTKKHVTQLIGSDVNTWLPIIKDKAYVKGWEKFLDGVSANSKAILTAFREVYPNTPYIKSIVNYRGVNIQLFKPGNKGSDTLQFLFIGGMPAYFDLPFKDDTKGGRTLMRIWSELDQTIPLNCKLIFGGPRTEIEEVLTWRESLKQKDQVTIVGKLKPDEVRKYMAESHVVLIPSKEEGTPNACFEAMASGCMVIGSDVGGTPELIEHTIDGIILPHDAHIGWVNAVTWAIEHEEQVWAMGVKAREKAEKNLDQHLFTERLTKLYHEVLSNVRN